MNLADNLQQQSAGLEIKFVSTPTIQVHFKMIQTHASTQMQRMYKHVSVCERTRRT